MAVAQDASGTVFTGAATTSFSHNSLITVGSGANRALIVMAQFGSSVATVGTITATWDVGGTAQVMFKIGSQNESDNSACTFLFGLLAPTAGNLTLQVAWTGSASYTICAVSFTGADQGSPAGTFKNFISGASNTTNLAAAFPAGGAALNSPVNDMGVFCAASNNAGFDVTTGGTGQTGTFLYGDNVNVSGGGIYIAGAGASTSCAISTIAGDGVQPACWVACDIAAVGTVAAFPCGTPMYMM
jgi:hypothetical protein